MFKKYILFLLLLLISFPAKPSSPDWNINASAYEFSMLVTCVANIDGIDLKNANDKIAAFSGGVLCGVASPVYIEAIDRNIFYLMVMSNSSSNSEIISFKVYDATTGQVKNALNTMTFERNKATGSAQTPWLISNSLQKNGVEIQVSGFVENLPAGTIIGSLTTWDNGKAVTATYNLPSGVADNGKFAISGNNLITASTFNYEVKSAYQVQIRSVSTEAGIQTQNFDLNLADINESPVAINISCDSISENMPAGTVVGKLSTIDEDTGEEFTYNIVPASIYFNISGDELLTTKVLDFEQKSSHLINIEVKDKAGNSLSRIFLIKTLDSNDAPLDVKLTGDTIFSGLPPGITVGVVAASDEDKDDFVRFYLPEGINKNNKFSIHPVTGLLKTAGTFTSEDAGTANIQVLVEDSQGGKTYTDIPLNIEDKGFQLIANEINVSFAVADPTTMTRYWHGKEVFIKVSKVDHFATFKFECSELIESYNIFDVNGVQKSSANPNDKHFYINASMYARGIYFVRITTALGVSTEKMTVN